MLALSKPEHLDLITTWWNLGGMNRGITLTELLTLPDDLVSDVEKFMAEYGRRKRAREGSKAK